VEHLKPGDIIMSTTDSLGSRFIRWFTGSKYSHASIYNGSGKIIHAVALEGVCTRWCEDLEKQCSVFDAYRWERATDAQRMQIVSFATSKIGYGYDYWHLIILAYRILKRTLGLSAGDYSPDRFVCFELVAEAYNSAGLELAKIPDNFIGTSLVDDLNIVAAT